MSTIVAAVAASHATAMKTRYDQTKDMVSAERFMDGMREAAAIIAEAKPDALVVVGSNHFQGFFLDMMPAFALGTGEVVGLGDGGSPKGDLLVDLDLARELAFGLSDREFDMAISLRLELDHGITQSLQYLTPELDLPMVPLVVNTFAPPLPTYSRSFALGEAVRAVIEADGQDKRIALVASGGISHHLPFMMKWYDDLSPDERKMVDAHFRHASREYFDRRRMEIMEQVEKPFINEEFDRKFLQALSGRDWDALKAYSNDELEEEAGNAAQETKAWAVVAAAAGGKARTLAYSAMYEWHTGMGVAAFEVEPSVAI